MATPILEVRVGLSGWTGGPGVNVWHFSQGTDLNPNWSDILVGVNADLQAAYASLNSYLLGGLTIDFPTLSRVYDSVSGAPIEEAADDSALSFVSSAKTTNTSRATQLGVTLIGDQFFGRRRAMGRKFIGPLDDFSIDTSGQITNVCRAALVSAFEGLTSGLGPRMAVWRRPTTPTSNDGRYADIVSIRPQRVPAVLRSRRG